MKFFIMLIVMSAISTASAKDHITTGLEVVEALQLKPIYVRKDLGVAVLNVTERQKQKKHS